MDSPREGHDDQPRPAARALAGVRVVELATGVPGPYAGKMLADFGAEVIKLEPPGGDPARQWGPFPGADPAVPTLGPSGAPEDGGLHLHLNTNKRSMVCDLTDEADRDVARGLIAGADVVIESSPPGWLDSVGLGVAQLRADHPALVVASVTPFGQYGPYAAWAGSEIVRYAMGGPMHATGYLEREPLKLAGFLIGYQAGSVAALAALAGLRSAEQTGVGTWIDLSEFEAQAGCIDRRMVFLLRYAYNGHETPRLPHGVSSLLASGIYPAADGYVQVVTPPGIGLERLRATLADDDLPDDELAEALRDPAWAANPDVPGLIEAAIYNWLASRTMAEATADAQANGWAMTPLHAPSQVLGDPQLAARGFFCDVDHPAAGRLRVPGPPFRIGDSWALERPAPLLGQHDGEVRAHGWGSHQRAAQATRATLTPSVDAAAQSPLPLAGIRVLDLTVVWAGPYATMLLGDLGADVIRVENVHLYSNTRGALARPPQDMVASLGWLASYPDDDPGLRPYNRNAFFNCHARNKRSVTVDLRRPDGREAFLRLVEQADMVVENNSVRVLSKLGIDWDTLHRRNPRLIALRMPALGLDGPFADYVGYGANFEAMCGLTFLRGYPGDDPSALDATYYMDAASGVAAASAALMALRRRDATGIGELVEVAQTENMVGRIGEYLIDASRCERTSEYLPDGNRHPTNAPQGAYPCREQSDWVVISIDDDAAWQRFVVALGAPAWANDTRFATAAGRRAHHEEIDSHISAWTTQLDRWEVTTRCQDHGVAAGPVLGDADCFSDLHLRTRGFFRRNGSSEVGFHDYPGHLWQWSGPPMRWGEPCVFGKANEDVWRNVVGMDEATYAAFCDAGHIGTDYLGPDGPL